MLVEACASLQFADIHRKKIKTMITEESKRGNGGDVCFIIQLVNPFGGFDESDTKKMG